MKVYVVKQPEGAYDSYTETVVKVFIDKAKAVNYVKEENSKKPFDQSKKCEGCEYIWLLGERKYQSKPSCFKSHDDYCEPYFEKYIDVQELFFEEYEVEDIADYTKQVRKEVCEEIGWKLNRRLNGVVNGKYSDEFFNGYSYCSSDIENILDQIQGETKWK